MPGYSALPPNTSANPGACTVAASKPSSAAISGECASRHGAATGVGDTDDHAAPVTSRRRGPVSVSPGSSRMKRLSNTGDIIDARRTKNAGSLRSRRSGDLAVAGAGLQRLHLVGLHALLALHGDEGHLL